MNSALCPQNSALVAVDFKKRRAYQIAIDSKGFKVRGIYTDAAGNFYERPIVKIHGRSKRTWRKLKSTTIARAQLELADKRAKQIGATIGNGIDRDPYARHASTAPMLVGELCDFYLQSGCPKRRNISSPRTTQTLREEQSRVAMLKQWWAEIPADKIELGDCTQYARWRRTKITGGKTGDRQIDKELVTLSQIFWWATQNSKKTNLAKNPIRNDRPKFCDPATVKHCRDFQPENGDELHTIARMFFQVQRSEVLGWQTLLEAMIGPRSSELLKLRWDARAKRQAGYIARIREGRVLYLYNSTSSKGTNEYIKIDSTLEKCLEALRAWRDRQYPESPWFFPSPEDPALPLGSTALTHGLARVTKALKIPKRTSHGLRSYFVNVHRSRGVPDAKIALMIGQKSGGKLIVDVYGTVPPDELSWMPSKGKEPAWTHFTEPDLPQDFHTEPTLQQLDLFQPIALQPELPF